MNKKLLMTALLLAGWIGVGVLSIAKMLEPALLLDVLRLFTLC